MTMLDVARMSLAQAEAWKPRNERDRRAQALVVHQLRRFITERERQGSS